MGKILKFKEFHGVAPDNLIASKPLEFRFADWESDGNGTHMEDYYSTLSYSSTHNVQIEYSEGYEGSYEAVGGKVTVPDALAWSGSMPTASESAGALFRRLAHSDR